MYQSTLPEGIIIRRRAPIRSIPCSPPPSMRARRRRAPPARVLAAGPTPRTQILNDTILAVVMDHIVPGQEWESLLRDYPPESQCFREARSCMYNLALTSRQMFSVVRRFLYRWVFISTAEKLALLSFALPKGDPPNAEYVRYVAVAKDVIFLHPWSMPVVDNKMIMDLRARGRPTIEIQRQSNSHGPYCALTENLMAAVLARCHHLRGLHLAIECPRSESGLRMRNVLEYFYMRQFAAPQLRAQPRSPDPYSRLRKLTFQVSRPLAYKQKQNVTSTNQDA